MVCSVTVELVYGDSGLTTASGTDFYLSLKTYGDYFISLLFANPNDIPIMKLVVKRFSHLKNP